MSDDDEGLPLADALRVYGDPELWAAYESARSKRNSIPPKPPWIGGWRSDREAWAERYQGVVPAARAALDRAWQTAVTDFKRRLRSGELVATGLKLPLEDEHSKRIVIASHLWSVLVPDFRHSAAKGGGLKMGGIRVRRCATPQGAGHEDVRSEQRPGGPPVPEEPRRGRPNIKSELAAEMRRRAQCGELRQGVTAECRALRAWAEQHLQGRDIPEVESIRKALSKLYQSLRAEINRDK